MGASVSWLSGLLFSKKEIRVLILGLVCSALSTSQRYLRFNFNGTSAGQCRKDNSIIPIEGMSRLSRKEERRGDNMKGPMLMLQQIGEVVTTIPT